MKVAEVFRLAIMFSFIIAGFSKLFSLNEAKKFPEKIGFLSGKYGEIMGGGMPFIELIIGLFGIIYNNYIINIMVMAILLFFILLNLKYTLERKDSKCFCYGKLINTKIGKGGLIHYLYQLMIFVLSIIGLNGKINVINLAELLNLVILAFLMFVNGIIIRRFIEKLGI